MSLAVFTDSTTAQASPALTFRPTSGNSTKTTSVNSCCAWSVMPTVATPPAARTHSCDFAYFKSEGMFAICKLSQGLRQRSISFSIDWPGHNHRPGAFATDLNFDRGLHLRVFRRHITHPNADAQRWTLCPADYFADLCSRRLCAPNRVSRP